MQCRKLPKASWMRSRTYKNTREEKEKTTGKNPGRNGKIAFLRYIGNMSLQGQKVRGVDFDDMLKECEELLQNNTPQREYWQKRFSHILIDEFQDINYRQYCIVRLLAERHKNVFAVGDDDQAIYSFRGARPWPVCRCLYGNLRQHRYCFAPTTVVIRTLWRLPFW